MKKYGVAIFLLMVALSAGGMYWVKVEVDEYVNRVIKVDDNRLLTVPVGANYYSLIRQFVAEGIIETSSWDRVAVKFYPALSELKVGTYQIEAKMTLMDVFSLIKSGKEHQFSITFVEGNRFDVWREQLADAPFMTQRIADLSEAEIAAILEFEHRTLEGLLLPETYYFVAGQSDLSILKRASNELQNVLNKAWLARDRNLPIASPYELLTLASIIEKETAVDAERAKVASVFVNRLNKGMRLQTDPTVIYGMGDQYNGNIRKKDLRRPTPFNTYVIFGLPPTPIAMPSKASILAAAFPAETPYYYFVADGLGGHQFSITLAEHNRAVKQYLKTLKNK